MTIPDYSNYPHHPKVEKLINILSSRTQNPDKSFFTILVTYYMSKMASMMRAKINARGFGKLPVNFYGIALGPSGLGKGHSMDIMERQVMQPFMDTFLEMTRPYIISNSLGAMANKRALRNGTDVQDELEKCESEFKKLGAYISSFDSGTAPAVKQFRHQLLMSDIGSINFEVDEIGNNLLNSKEITDIYLELWDGAVKAKLTKNTADSVRNEEIFGKTPTNMLGFGTPDALFDGGHTENMYKQMLITGYARRCFFGYSSIETYSDDISIDDRLAQLMDDTSDEDLLDIANELELLANPLMHGFTSEVDMDVMREILTYQKRNMSLVGELRKSDEIRRTELRGRHFKTIKLAGVFAFMDGSSKVTSDHFRAAVRVAEDSGEAFAKMMRQDPAHARLARFLVDFKEPATLSDLMEELPFFPKAAGSQRDMIKHATAWAYKNNITIKKRIIDDIETLQGEQLEETNLENIISSNSLDIAKYYYNATCSWEEMLGLYQQADYHWCNHHFLDGNRRQTSVIRGFNIIVLDIDGTCPLSLAQDILKEHTYHMYTTKSHTEDVHRYRIILPTSHLLKQSPEEFSEFMQNVLEFLPFDTDAQTGQANRKWLTNPASELFTNEGKLFNVLPFIPRTKKNEERKQQIIDMGNMGALERFFLTIALDGNRNNTLARYGFALVDAGYDSVDTRTKLIEFNAMLPEPLPLDELEKTAISSAVKKILTK